MKLFVVLSIAAFAVASLSTVPADSRSYINVTGDQLLDCNPDGIPDEAGGGDLGVWPTDGQGGVCFEAGHVKASASGTATISLADDLINPASMFLCQDLNANNQCPDDDAGEFALLACGSQALKSGVNWSPGVAMLIWVDGPVFGNPATSVCGNVVEGTGAAVSIALKGTISHT